MGIVDHVQCCDRNEGQHNVHQEEGTAFGFK